MTENTVTKRTFLGLLYIAQELIEKGYLQKDPNNPDNILVYRNKGSLFPEGWYSENIMGSISECFNNKAEQDSFLKEASRLGVDIEAAFKRAEALLGNTCDFSGEVCE